MSLLILGSRTEQLRASQSVSSAAERLRVRSQVQSACDQVQCLVPSNVHIEMRCGIVFVNQPYSFWFRSSMRNAALLMAARGCTALRPSWLHVQEQVASGALREFLQSSRRQQVRQISDAFPRMHWCAQPGERHWSVAG